MIILRMFAKKYFDCLVSPDTKVDNGSGGECNSGNFTYLPAQHIFGVSFLNLKTLLYTHNLSIFPLTTLE